jgi:hypothetical protein
MKILKKVKCIHCGTTIEENGKCNCGKVKVINGTITEGKIETDYIDITVQLLTE